MAQPCGFDDVSMLYSACLLLHKQPFALRKPQESSLCQKDFSEALGKPTSGKDPIDTADDLGLVKVHIGGKQVRGKTRVSP